MASITNLQAQAEPIAVVGSGCRFPGGANTPSKLWELLKHPRDLLTKVPKDRFNVDAFYHPDGTHHGCTNTQHCYFLEENTHAFDASFFNIRPHEADCIDPQHRLLLETVYEGLCAAGLKVEDLQGSSTAVYVGLMTNDYANIVQHDLGAIPTYAATGTSACILSNRVSYFFDWHGPSMTIDTACSSALVAVHQAVQTLRSRSSKVAIAAGANLILGPLPFIVESKLNMLSPNGRSRMWDAAADGYARGEGVATVVLKTLGQALKDGDHIECIIRETGVNQDGRSPGITMPNHAAQEILIRETYARAGLDLNKESDRCQYFEAHGTGTPAGDPQEAEAISTAFFGHRERSNDEDPLYVGSVKTVIGHTEGTAGIAGLLKASLAVQNATIPPNLLFDNLSPRVAPFYKNLRIVTKAKAWPQVLGGAPRRASVNSFGFGGTNAHVIVESYHSAEEKALHASSEPGVIPLVLSANSMRSLRSTMEDLLRFLKAEPDVTAQDLVWTMLQKRSILPIRRALAARTRLDACAALESEITAIDAKQSLAMTSELKRKPDVFGIFTGQGAQWPAMGKALTQTLPYAREVVERLDQSLATLPPEYRPSWTLFEQLSLEGEASNVKDATFSQPLCSAVQILLIELLTAAGVEFKAVAGHSSGEIACAFAAGLITAEQAIRIAYLRGVVTKLTSSPSGSEGAMLAVGTSFEDAQELCALEKFKGRLCVAASNAPDSVTISGDADAIQEVQTVLEDETKFTRLLKVDKAYHSHHMLPCVSSYVEALKANGCAIGEASHSTSTVWLSSVYPGKRMALHDVTAEYWKDNLVSPVLFSQAVKLVMLEHAPVDVAIEVGSHPALKGPSLATIQDCVSVELPYTGCMQRGGNDIDALTGALGYLWERFGSESLDIDSFNKKVMPEATPKSIAKFLPRYAWDNERTYWTDSRATRAFLHGEAPPHPLLGKLSTHSTPSTLQWHNYIRPRDIAWLDGHQLQGQTVFPAAGYAVMAMEAATYVAGDRHIQLLEVLNLSIGKAITFDDENGLVEINLTLELITNPANMDSIVFRFNIDSCLAKETRLSWSAGGQVVLTCGPSSSETLPTAQEEPPHMSKVNVDAFYRELAAIGYEYSKAFRGLSTVKRAESKSCGSLNLAKFQEGERFMVLHPATLDVAFQTFISAFCSPGDERLRSLHVPTYIGRIALNPWLSAVTHRSSSEAYFNSSNMLDEGDAIGGDIEVFVPGDMSTLFQIEQISFKPFSPPTAADDKILFSKWVWGPLSPDKLLDDPRHWATAEDKAATRDMERIVYFYIKSFLKNLSENDRLQAAPHHQRLIFWCKHIVTEAEEGRHLWYEKSWEMDTHSDIRHLCERLVHLPDVRLIQRTGENILDTVRENKNAFEIMDNDGLLTEFYEGALSFGASYHFFGELVAQITHRYQNMDILEIGAGTGGATKYILERNQAAFNSYTFTDISTGFFDQARETFAEYEDRMEFRALDIRREPEIQGFKQHSYDMVIASNVLHATPKLEETLTNVRSLLKPGGQLVIIEITRSQHSRAGFIFGLFADWWAGADEGRILEPFVSIERWEEILRRTGFSGIDSRTADPDAKEFPNSVFSTHAVDDRIRRLDMPLSIPMEGASPPIVIIGGSTAVTSKISSGLMSALSGRRLKVLTKLKDILGASIESKSTFVVLSELDNEFFAQLNDDNFESVKTILFYAQHVLWLTEGAWGDHPHQAMVIGLLRTLRLENVEVNIQALDVDRAEMLDVNVLAGQVLRLEAGSSSQEDGILWSAEPEIYLSRNRLLVPRLKVDKARNDRLNARRRKITTKVNIDECALSFRELRDNTYLQIEKKYSQAWEDTPTCLNIRVHYSLPKAIRIANLGYFYLIQGQILETDEVVIALSESNASWVEVPQGRTVSLKDRGDQESCVLLSVAAELMAHAIMSGAAVGTSVLVLNPFTFATEALIRRANNACSHVKFAAVHLPLQFNPDHWIKFHEKETQRQLINSLPAKMSGFFDLSDSENPSSVGRRLSDCLPNSCARYGSGYLAQDTSVSLSSEDDWTDSNLLAQAVKAVHYQPMRAVGPMVPAARIMTQERPLDISTVIDWRENCTVAARIQPVDSGNLFVDDKTYLLVGLAGDLGRSLCRWMILHGARHVVLASRNPRIDPRWLSGMSRLGGNVKVQPMNVANKQSLDEALAAIRKTMPRIGGIAFGPLVLQDILFKNMDLEMMEMVLDPKVKGARYLNELFSDSAHGLDFFVMFSSFVLVGGNPGQSAYTAANAYTHSLVEQRRARGLAGSTINIGAVYGVGFIAKAAREEDYSISKYMFDSLSEQDLHALFAEAVVSGRPTSRDDYELTTGMPFMDPVNRDYIPFFDDPRLGHFKLPDHHGKTSGDAATSAGSVKERLLKATSVDDVRQAIKEGLTAKLRTALQIPVDDNINMSTPLIDQGVDSLVAVTIGTWFSKQLNLDLPVLKILGGASVADLVDEAVERLHPSSIPLVQSVDTAQGTSSSAAALPEERSSAANLPQLQTLPDAKTSSASSTSDESKWEDSFEKPDDLETPFTDFEENEAPLKPALQRQEVMSFGQARFWRLRQLVKDPTTFNVTIGVYMKGFIDLNRLSRAFRISIRRHETFRTCFSDGDRPDRPMQAVMKTSRVRFESVQVKDRTAAEEGFKSLESHVYNLETGNTMKIVDFYWSANDHILVIGYNHMICDGWSYEQLFNEIGKLYNGEVLPTPPQYADFAVRQRMQCETGQMDPDIAYWESQYKTLPPVLPLLPLSQSRTRTTPVAWDHHEVSVRLDPMITARINERSRKHKATRMQFYLAAYHILLARLSGSADISIGVADANRSSLEDLSTLGYFFNLLPVRLQYSANDTFGEALSQTKTQMRDALKYSKVPYDVLLQRLDIPHASTHAPLFQAVFDYKQGQAESGSIGSSEMTDVLLSRSRTAFDITLEMRDDPTRDPLITFKLQSSLYAYEDVQPLIASYTTILSTFSRNPALRVEEGRLAAM